MLGWSGRETEGNSHHQEKYTAIVKLEPWRDEVVLNLHEGRVGGLSSHYWLGDMTLCMLVVGREGNNFPYEWSGPHQPPLSGPRPLTIKLSRQSNPFLIFNFNILSAIFNFTSSGFYHLYLSGIRFLPSPTQTGSKSIVYQRSKPG